MKMRLVAILFALILPPALVADELSEVQDLTQEKILALTEILKDNTLDKETRNAKIIAEIEPIFDFPRMAQLSLGRAWKELDASQKKEFSELFIKRMQDSYLEKLEFYTDEKVEFQEAKKVKNRIHVLTLLLSKGDTYEMLYKLYKSKEGWKIYDVEILGVSVIQTYRSQLQSALKNRSIEDLLAQLRANEGPTLPEN